MSETTHSSETSTDGEGSVEPEMRYRLNPLVLTVFKRETAEGYTIRNCDLQRVYTRDDGDSFEYTHSLRPQDLRKAAALLTVAANRLDDFSIEHIDDTPTRSPPDENTAEEDVEGGGVDD